jgi:hypothetical protein
MTLRLRPVAALGCILCHTPPRDAPTWQAPAHCGRSCCWANAVACGPRLAAHHAPPHAPAMFVVTEADAAAIRAVYQQRGEFSAAVELRRRFPGIGGNAQARECARIIAGWKPLPLRPKRMPKPPRSW